jgi:uncharacterized membrane protein
VQDHVDLIAKHEAEFLAQRTQAERLSDRVAGFVGSIPFVVAHLGLFAAWVLFNSLAGARRFDPRPFSLLSTLVGLEAILLASFILMRQARLARRSDERDHLMLQILLLSEREVTTVLQIERKIAAHLGLDRVANTPEARELSRETSIEDVAQTIRDSLSESDAPPPSEPVTLGLTGEVPPRTD